MDNNISLFIKPIVLQYLIVYESLNVVINGIYYEIYLHPILILSNLLYSFSSPNLSSYYINIQLILKS